MINTTKDYCIHNFLGYFELKSIFIL